jgi:polyisoprenoid-binding protein YceI
MVKRKSLKNFVLVIAGLTGFFGVGMNVYGQMHPVAKSSLIKFTIKNFGFKVSGSFAAPQGDIRFNPDSLPSAYFHIMVKSSSVNTDNESRDNHLRETDYLDVEHYPTMKFISENVRSIDKGATYEVAGKLTIKNKTEQIIIPFKAQKSVQGYIFMGNFKMKRRDFDVGGSSTISDELTVEVQVLAQ